MFDSLQQGRELPWTHISKDRMDYAENYGMGVQRSLPYADEVDMLHEDPDRFQENNHWYSSLDKPNLDNIDVLRKLNARKLEELGSLYSHQKMMERLANQGEPEEDAPLKKSILKKSNREINKEKDDYKARFKRYLHNKNKKGDRSMSPGEEATMKQEFDRYQCTSPNPKSILKDNVVHYNEMVYDRHYAGEWTLLG